MTGFKVLGIGLFGGGGGDAAGDKGGGGVLDVVPIVYIYNKKRLYFNLRICEGAVVFQNPHMKLILQCFGD